MPTPPKDEKIEKLARLADNGDNLTVYATHLGFLSEGEIADFEKRKILLFRGYSNSLPCNKCPKQPCTVYPRMLTYPDGQQKGVCHCIDPEQGGRLEFEPADARFWDINIQKLGVRKIIAEQPPAEAAANRRKNKFEKTAAIANHLQAKPTATSKEISKATGIDSSDIRRIWGPIKKAVKEGKSKLRSGYKNKGEIDVIDPSASCKYCAEPLMDSFECKICDETISGECKTCHFTQLHPDKAVP